MADFTDADRENMAAALLAGQLGCTFREAESLMRGDELQHAVFVRMANAALEHPPYLPSRRWAFAD